MNSLDPHHISATRLRNTIAVVLLAHMAIFWMAQGELAVLPISDASNQTIMADLVTEIPSVLPTPQAKPVLQATPSPTPVKAQPKTEEVAVRTNSDAPSHATTNTSAAPPAADTVKASSSHVVEPSADAEYLKNPPPPYPRASRRLGEQGTVVVRVFIDTQGLPQKAEVRTSSGFARLDQAALDAVGRWRFVPGHRNGTPEATWFNIPVRFVLE